MKHYFLLFLIITNFPIVSYGFFLFPTKNGFSVFPTRMNIGISTNQETNAYTNLSNSERNMTGYGEEGVVCFYGYSPHYNGPQEVCRYKQRENGTTYEYSYKNKIPNRLPLSVSLQGDPIYAIPNPNLGFNFKITYRNVDSSFNVRLMDYPIKDVLTKLSYQKISIGIPILFTLGDKSLGANGNNLSLSIGWVPKYEFYSKLKLQNKYGSITPENIKGPFDNFEGFLEIRIGSFYLNAESLTSKYKFKKNAIGNSKDDVLRITQTSTIFGYTIFF